MAEQLLVYISAAPQSRAERDLLARLISEVPTSLGWSIQQTPTSPDRAPDLEAVRRAHLFMLILGSDIQAPMGLEWMAARQTGVPTLLWYHAGKHQTQAAQGFMRMAARFERWQAFTDTSDLCHQVMRQIVDHLVKRRDAYQLDEAEVQRLRAWSAAANVQAYSAEQGRSVANASAVVLSVERFTPSGGRLIGTNS